MRARVVLMISMWALMAVGAVRLFGDVAVPTSVGTGVLAVALLIAWRSRRRRRPSWRRNAEPAFPTGPRRVLLLETGLARPE
jgi:hypothetical protein